MKAKKMKLIRKTGFSILAVILVIVAVIVAIGLWALSGSSNTSNSSDSATNIAVSSILNDSSAIKLQWDTLLINSADSNKIKFDPTDSTSENNVFNLNNGIAQPSVNSKVIREGAASPEGLWVYSKSLSVNSNANPDNVIVLAGIKDTVCKELNKQINNSDTTPVATSMNFGSSYVLGATKSNPNTAVVVDFPSVGVTQQWNMGCIAGGTPDSNLFYRVLKMN